MQIKKFVFNPFQVNTYLVYDEGEAVIIDPAMMEISEQEEFNSFVEINSLKIKLIAYTHGHVDHVLGSAWAKRKYSVPVAGSKMDDDLLYTAEQHAMAFGFEAEKPEEIDIDLNDNSIIEFGNAKLEVISVPGHSMGGLCFIHHPSKNIFCGDSVFENSVGRTDLPGGNHDELISSIKEKILKLQDDYVLYPGHGDKTSIGEERRENPYLI